MVTGDRGCRDLRSRGGNSALDMRSAASSTAEQVSAAFGQEGTLEPISPHIS
jgi:hypothetical protein